VIVSRIAPSPSGYLHIGNAVNFLLTSWSVREAGGKLLLRIDDMDSIRCRTEFVDDIFWMLDWLNIDIDEGPSSTAEFFREYSMRHKTDYYRSELLTLAEHGLSTYACTCSRRRIARDSNQTTYPGFCRNSSNPLETDHSALRIHVPCQTQIEVGSQHVRLDETMGDFVLWRKDGQPAYQLASVIEDRDLGVNLIVRGADLLESTAAQLFLAPALGAKEFASGDFWHHKLVTDSAGHKLAKSAGVSSVRAIAQDPGARGRVVETARRIQHAS
jgi:glutamyl/glutaminyl-tRNA synthetase